MWGEIVRSMGEKGRAGGNREEWGKYGRVGKNREEQGKI